MENYQPFHEGLKRLSGNAAAQLAAVGGIGASDLQAALSGIKRTPRLVVFGDSITDMCGGLRLNASIENYAPNGYLTWAQIFSGKRLNFIVNAGISGDNTAGMLARIQADVINYDPDVVVVFGGINDCSGALVGNIDSIVTTVTANLAAIYLALENVGTTVIAIPIWPVSAFRSGWETATYPRQAISRINEWIFEQSQTRKNLIVADIGAAFRDPRSDNEPLYSNDTSLNGVGYPLYLADGLHPSASGACAAGRLLADVICNHYSAKALIPSCDDTTNLLANPALAGASGVTPPTGWTYSDFTGGVTKSLSYVNRSDGIAGRWLRSTHTGGVSVSKTAYIGATTVVAGDVFVAECEYRMVSGFSQPYLEIELRDLGATQIYGTTRDGYLSGATVGGDSRSINSSVGMRSGVLRTPPLTAIADAAGGFVQFTVVLIGDGTIDIGRVNLRKI